MNLLPDQTVSASVIVLYLPFFSLSILFLTFFAKNTNICNSSNKYLPGRVDRNPAGEIFMIDIAAYFSEHAFPDG